MELKKYNPICTFLLDYDGVVRFSDKELNKKILDKWMQVFTDWAREVEKGHIVMSTLRGITYFTEAFHIALEERIMKHDHISYTLVGNNGSFVYDLKSNSSLADVNPLSIDDLEYIIRNEYIKKLMAVTGQNDFHSAEIIHKYNILTESYEQILQKETKLFWDNGFPGSKQILKCAVDLPEDYTSILDADFFAGFREQGINVNITRKVMELTSIGTNKSSRLDWLRNIGLVEPTTIAIADSPEGADKVMFDYIDSCGDGFISMPNGNSKYDSENVLYENLLKIFEDMGLSSEA